MKICNREYGEDEKLLKLRLNFSRDLELFYKGYGSDLIVRLKKSIWKLHTFKVSAFTCLGKPPYTGEVTVRSNLKEHIFSLALSLIYGADIKLSRTDALELFRVAQWLQFVELQSNLLEDIQAHLQQYDIFPLLELSLRNSLDGLTQSIIQMLHDQSFEQVHYNKFDLMCCTESAFKLVIQSHNKYRAKTAKGFSWHLIEGLIKDYCSTNFIPLDKRCKLLKELIDQRGLFLEGLSHQKSDSTHSLIFPVQSPTAQGCKSIIGITDSYLDTEGDHENQITANIVTCIKKANVASTPKAGGNRQSLFGNENLHSQRSYWLKDGKSFFKQSTVDSAPTKLPFELKREVPSNLKLSGGSPFFKIKTPFKSLAETSKLKTEPCSDIFVRKHEVPYSSHLTISDQAQSNNRSFTSSSGTKAESQVTAVSEIAQLNQEAKKNLASKQEMKEQLQVIRANLTERQEQQTRNQSKLRSLSILLGQIQSSLRIFNYDLKITDSKITNAMRNRSQYY